MAIVYRLLVRQQEISADTGGIVGYDRQLHFVSHNGLAILHQGYLVLTARQQAHFVVALIWLGYIFDSDLLLVGSSTGESDLHAWYYRTVLMRVRTTP